MSIATFIAQPWETLSRHFENRAAARQLHAMTDAQLADIGISRDQIEFVVYGEGTQRANAHVSGIRAKARPARAVSA
ncbi:MAG: DUF1127 domain-containing protein [Pseudomonadota bacterium]